MTATIRVYDTATGNFGTVPANADAVMPYMDGFYNNVGAARTRFPHLFQEGKVITLTCRANDADGVDWEPGNTCPNPASWYKQQHHLGRWRPLYYADLSDTNAHIVPSLNSIGLKVNEIPPGPSRPVRILTAHPTQVPHICGPHTCGGLSFDADGTQWWWSSIAHSQADIDISLFLESAFQGGTVPVADPYAIFYDQNYEVVDPRTGKKFKSNERDAVKAYDQALKHPQKNMKVTIDAIYTVLAHRKFVWEQAHRYLDKNGKASWNEDRRGPRWHSMNARTEGL